jgi:hypothetical protein
MNYNPRTSLGCFMSEELSMKKFTVVTLVNLLLLFGSSCARQPEQQQQSQAEYRTTATIKDIMDSMVDPGADFIWESVATVISAKGTEEKAPHTDEEWKEVRRRAVMLLEATNLLQIPGRQVAKPHEKSQNPGIELEPEKIEELINKDRAAWIKYAHGLHDATMEAFKAIEEKDSEKLLDVGNQIDEACEKCHLQYWYPDEKRPGSAPSQRN